MNKVEFYELFGEKEFNATQVTREFYPFICFLTSFCPKMDTMIEVGVFKGGTFKFWHKFLSDNGILIGVDLNDRGFIPSVQERFKEDKRVKFVIGNSIAPEVLAQTEKELQGRKADFLFIDGNHERTHVKADFDLYRGFVKQGGLIVFHDLVNENIVPLWNEAIKDDEFQAYIEFRGKEPGIGVLIKKT